MLSIVSFHRSRAGGTISTHFVLTQVDGSTHVPQGTNLLKIRDPHTQTHSAERSPEPRSRRNGSRRNPHRPQRNPSVGRDRRQLSASSCPNHRPPQAHSASEPSGPGATSTETAQLKRKKGRAEVGPRRFGGRSENQHRGPRDPASPELTSDGGTARPDPTRPAPLHGATPRFRFADGSWHPAGLAPSRP